MKANKKTTLRAIRITKELDALLAKDSEEKKVSVNALISSILTKYAEWGRFAEKLGFISIPHDDFRIIIDGLDAEKLDGLGDEAGSRYPEMQRLFFGEVSIKAFLAVMAAFCRNTGLVNCLFTQEGKDYKITMTHALGKKWSDFFDHYFRNAVRVSFQVDPRIEVTANSIFVKFTIP